MIWSLRPLRTGIYSNDQLGDTFTMLRNSLIWGGWLWEWEVWFTRIHYILIVGAHKSEKLSRKVAFEPLNSAAIHLHRISSPKWCSIQLSWLSAYSPIYLWLRPQVSIRESVNLNPIIIQTRWSLMRNSYQILWVRSSVSSLIPWSAMMVSTSDTLQTMTRVLLCKHSTLIQVKGVPR